MNSSPTTHSNTENSKKEFKVQLRIIGARIKLLAAKWPIKNNKEVKRLERYLARLNILLGRLQDSQSVIKSDQLSGTALSDG